MDETKTVPETPVAEVKKPVVDRRVNKEPAKPTTKEVVEPAKEEFTDDFIEFAGFYTVNVDDGLTLPVIIEHGGEDIINMQHVKVTETVECGEETDEMREWIKKGFLIKEKKRPA